ncbi:MAG: amidohydrolase family protein [Nostocoides sp.]
MADTNVNLAPDFAEMLAQNGIGVSQEKLTLLPEPEPTPVFTPFISVDDHALEPPELFTSRVPARFKDAAPRVDMSSGRPRWLIEDKVVAVVGGDAAVGRPMKDWIQLEIGYDEMRPGVRDPHQRTKDMDIIGEWASLCFPSIAWGFAGKMFSQMKDRDLGFASFLAYNDWMLEEWCGAAPERFIPCQIPWLADPEVAATQIRNNADRGFKCVTFSENPHGLGFASLYSEEWDPFFAACEETGTIINLHVGSSGSVRQPSPETPVAAVTALFPLSGIEALYDWIFARIPVRFPGLRIVTSEAGVAWVPLVVDRLGTLYRRRVSYSPGWQDSDPTFLEVMHRNFYFTSIDDPSAFRNLDIIGTDKVMLESDYPHADGTWPDTQSLLRRELAHLPEDVVQQISYGTAMALYRHPEPDPVWLARITEQEH